MSFLTGTRRRFLKNLALGAGVLGTAIMGIVPVLKGWVKKMRPPGALDEGEFLASCIKCGQCVQVCPVQAIKLADMGDGFGVGTPYIDPRSQACDFSCDGLQCVLACPTGALTHHINYAHEAKMAVAKVVAPERCLAVQGKGFKGTARGPNFRGKLRYNEIDRWTPIPVADHPYDLESCDLCVRTCPIEIRYAMCEAGTPPSGEERQCPPEHAIRMKEIESGGTVKTFIPEILSGCVGCGVCMMICPMEPPVIVMEGYPGSGRVI
ncbi:MAG: 4Fe-4S ferredoxin [Acidobacteria bacterium]|nr:MAG: 4Fe-4S ferredoxin [Acidobacteriota bacterium]